MSKRRSSTTLRDLSPIIIALIALGGTIATAYFTFRGQLAPKELEISATQTVESAKLRNVVMAPSMQVPLIPVETMTSPSPISITLLSSATLVTMTPSIASYSIAISEVMANPCGRTPESIDTYWNEYIELYNYGNESVDVSGWWISDGENVRGNPDMIVAWETRFPRISFGNNLETESTAIPPGKVAIILSPKYLSGDPKLPDFLKPYILPENTIILTIADGPVLGSDDFGIETVNVHNTVTLYQGTNNEIYRLISTYGSPVVTASPINLSDDGKDGIPLVLNECYAAERIIVDGADVDINWRPIKNGTPGTVPSNP